MAGLKTEQQGDGGFKTGQTRKGDPGAHNEGAEFGASTPSTSGTNRDADASGTSHNQGHGHPREQRGDDS